MFPGTPGYVQSLHQTCKIVNNVQLLECHGTLITTDKYLLLRQRIDTLERIERAAEIIPELRYLSHHERLKGCGLTILGTRRLRRD